MANIHSGFFLGRAKLRFFVRITKPPKQFALFFIGYRRNGNRAYNIALDKQMFGISPQSIGNDADRCPKLPDFAARIIKNADITPLARLYGCSRKFGFGAVARPTHLSNAQGLPANIDKPEIVANPFGLGYCVKIVRARRLKLKFRGLNGREIRAFLRP